MKRIPLRTHGQEIFILFQTLSGFLFHVVDEPVPFHFTFVWELDDGKVFAIEDCGSPSRYQRLYLFIKVLSLLCPNLTDAPKEVLEIKYQSQDKTSFERATSNNRVTPSPGPTASFQPKYERETSGESKGVIG
jgi:hypothetical protein